MPDASSAIISKGGNAGIPEGGLVEEEIEDLEPMTPMTLVFIVLFYLVSEKIWF